jgi:hypothetical protein
VRRAGCIALPAVDLVKGPRRFDLCDDVVYEAIKREIIEKRVRYLHLGTPCTTFSSALRGRARKRSVRDPVGPEATDPKIATANLLVRRSVELCRLLSRLGGFWSVENPGTSLLWRFPEIVSLACNGFYVRFDACAYGAQIAGEGRFRKRTRLLTNMGKLRLLERRCNCAEPHVILAGQTKTKQGWRSRTALASEYSHGLCRRWADLARDHLVPRLSRPLSDWAKLALLACGDIESNPGPRSGRSAALIADLLVNDITQDTATKYNRAIEKFETWLGYRDRSLQSIMMNQGAATVIQLAVEYVRSLGRAGELTTFGANSFGAGLRRFLLLSISLGFAVIDIKSVMLPLWKIIRSLHLALPPEFRAPVPSYGALALCTWAWVSGHYRFVVITLLAHHCLLRPEEARSIRFSDIIMFGPDDLLNFPGVFGVVAVRRPKTRRQAAHAPQQHVLIEDGTLAQCLRRLLGCIPSEFQNQPLWTQPAHTHLAVWRKGLAALGMTDTNWLPAGLRGGGATEHFLKHREVLQLRRRGRWTQLATLDRYLQEGVLLLTSRTNTHFKIKQIGGLLAPLLLDQSCPPPPLHLSTF